MLLEIENKFHNSFPYNWIYVEIKNSRTVLEKIIDDQDHFLFTKKNELLETLNTSNYVDDETHIYFYEKNKWLTELFESNILDSLYVLVIINIENYLNVILKQIQSIRNECKVPKSIKKCDKFGHKWKLKYQDYLLNDLSLKVEEGWELITILYKLRNKFSHSGCFIDINLKASLESLNFKGLTFYEDENLKQFFVKINSEFIKEALSRLTDTLYELMDNIYKKYCLDYKNNMPKT